MLRKPLVTIGGVPATVISATLTPGLAGYYSIKATVPSNAPAGDDIPVIVEIAGLRSPLVTIAIKLSRSLLCA